MESSSGLSDSDASDSGSEFSLSYSSELASSSSSSSSDDGIVPYRFEPEYDDEEAAQQAQAAEAVELVIDEERLGNNDWCSCSGGCTPMPKVKECVCCKEVEQVVAKMDGYEEPLDCITEHPGFATGCLDPWVLEIAYYQYRQQYGGGARNDATANERNRHVAYRQLARWCWGFLGRNVNRIRDTFPSEVYRGFEEI